MDRKSAGRTVETLIHDKATRKNIPTAEYQSVMEKEQLSPIRAAYERRNRDLDPQLVWRNKDQLDWSDLVVHAAPLYIQEKMHPKVLIDDLRQRTSKSDRETQLDLFSDFNGLPSEEARTEFYQHDANWSNRMILGDSLQVMASLAEREGLRGKVQCIYVDPPYGIRFNSNFQWSTTSRDVKDGKADHITREPEQVKAYRDTWRDGIHSYLTYLRDRLSVARELLSDSGSVFVQIGDENVHRVRAVVDEVFGDDNFISGITFSTTSSRASAGVDNVYDFILWYAKSKDDCKVRKLYVAKGPDSDVGQFDFCELPDGTVGPLVKGTSAEGDVVPLAHTDTTSQGETASGGYPFLFRGEEFRPPANRHWSHAQEGMLRLERANRLFVIGRRLRVKRYLTDNPVVQRTNQWIDTTFSGFGSAKVYVVQTHTEVVSRCVLMTTDPGDLVLDPTCGSATTAYVAEQWGRRWITIDTSRVALALARGRIMGARYPYYILADSRDGRIKEAQLAGVPFHDAPTQRDIRQGFVYERVPHVTLRAIANNAEIDVIWQRYQNRLRAVTAELNTVLGKHWEDWEIPREACSEWPNEVTKVHANLWRLRAALQGEIDSSIAAKADFEHLYDKPYEDNRTIRVAGPFTVESLSPHRAIIVDENDELLDRVAETKAAIGEDQGFLQMVLDNLRRSGVQQAHKEDRIDFASITTWPGRFISAEGRYVEGNGELGSEKRAAIFVGPEFGTVSRPDLVAAAREAGDASFDVLVACAFNYDAHSSEFSSLGRIPVLKARMNADLHMADELKNTGKGNLFVIFGEPDIDVLDGPDSQIKVKINGVDVFHPNTGEVRSDGADGIACWFIDTDYNEESFFVRHAYFLGANDPYKALKTTLRAQINEEAWASLNSDISHPFGKPKSGRIAVKVINHLGDEVMKVFAIR